MRGLATRHLQPPHAAAGRFGGPQVTVLPHGGIHLPGQKCPVLCYSHNPLGTGKTVSLIPLGFADTSVRCHSLPRSKPGTCSGRPGFWYHHSPVWNRTGATHFSSRGQHGLERVGGKTRKPVRVPVFPIWNCTKKGKIRDQEMASLGVTVTKRWSQQNPKITRVFYWVG